MTHMKTLTQPILLRNLNCIYCGNPFDDDSGVRKTREHVIGRSFVPRGSLENQWNLIANACESCNRSKSALEDDISAITLFRSLGDPASDPGIRAEAARKLKPDGAVSHRWRGVCLSRTKLFVAGDRIGCTCANGCVARGHGRTTQSLIGWPLRLLVIGFLSHLHSLMVTMSQKSSVLQPANSVSQALIPDTSIMLDGIEEPLDEITLGIEGKVQSTSTSTVPPHDHFPPLDYL
jgi:hypothetical protein